MEQHIDYCPVCKSNNKSIKLELRQINLTEAVYICSDRSCIYPAGYHWKYVERNILNIEDSDSDESSDNKEIVIINCDTNNENNTIISESNNDILNNKEQCNEIINLGKQLKSNNLENNDFNSTSDDNKNEFQKITDLEINNLDSQIIEQNEGKSLHSIATDKETSNLAENISNLPNTEKSDVIFTKYENKLSNLEENFENDSNIRKLDLKNESNLSRFLEQRSRKYRSTTDHTVHKHYTYKLRNSIKKSNSVEIPDCVIKHAKSSMKNPSNTEKTKKDDVFFSLLQTGYFSDENKSSSKKNSNPSREIKSKNPSDLLCTILNTKLSSNSGPITRKKILKIVPNKSIKGETLISDKNKCNIKSEIIKTDANNFGNKIKILKNIVITKPENNTENKNCTDINESDTLIQNSCNVPETIDRNKCESVVQNNISDETNIDKVLNDFFSDIDNNSNVETHSANLLDFDSFFDFT